MFLPIVLNRRFPWWSRFSHEPRSLEFIYQNARNYFLKEIRYKWAYHDSSKTARVDGPCFWPRILFYYYGKRWQKIYLYRLRIGWFLAWRSYENYPSKRIKDCWRCRLTSQIKGSCWYAEINDLLKLRRFFFFIRSPGRAPQARPEFFIKRQFAQF